VSCCSVCFSGGRTEAGGEILPAGPNPFVERVTIAPIVEDAVPFDDTITIPAEKGVYSRMK
jgi:hypothetical protein